MANIGEILEDWERIKDKPDVLGETRVTENQVGGTPADDVDKRAAMLPSAEQHAKIEEHLSVLFDKTKRSGAQSTLPGLILPSGKANFDQFHEQFTGTGRISPRSDKDEGFIPDPNASQNDGNTPHASVVLYERCIDCWDRVDKGNCVPDMEIIPPVSRFPGELEKWQALGLKPGMIVGSLFCGSCVMKFRKEHQRILQDPIKNAIFVTMGDTRIPLSAREAEEHKHAHRQRTRENIMEMIRQERDNPETQCFWGDALLP